MKEKILFKLLLISFYLLVKSEHQLLYREATEGHRIRGMYKNLLESITKEYYFEYAVVLCFTRPPTSLHMEKILENDLKKAIVLVDNPKENSIDFNLMKQQFLIIVYMPPSSGMHQRQREYKLLEKLAEIMDLRRQNLVLFVNGSINMQQQQQLEEFFKWCWEFKLINVMMVYENFPQTQLIYEYQQFPKSQIIQKNLSLIENGKIPLIPSMLRNVYGHKLLSIPDQIAPRSVVYRDGNNRLKFSGYLIKFLDLFAYYMNASIEYIHLAEENDSIDPYDFFNITQTEQVDIPASLAQLSGNENQLPLMSSHFESSKVCVMVPRIKMHSYKDFLRQRLTPFRLFYLQAIRYTITALVLIGTKIWSMRRGVKFSFRWIDFILHPYISTAMYGSPLPYVLKPTMGMRLLYVLTFFIGLMQSIMYTVQLHAFITLPSTQQYWGYHDLEANDMKILITPTDYKMYVDYAQNDFSYEKTLFEIVNSTQDFLWLQSAFNGTDAFSIRTPTWQMYAIQQQSMGRFIYTLTDICITPFMAQMAFVLPRNSIYKVPLNRLILRVREMGFLKYWLSTLYYELIKIGSLTAPDISVWRPRPVLTYEDFYNMFLIYGSGVCLASIVWLLELFFYNVKKYLCKYQ